MEIRLIMQLSNPQAATCFQSSKPSAGINFHRPI
jgi:hypothetical protein